ncbi:hypervirulence associated TUDOR domain-containing protein [Flavobacterium litorale]|uniref:DUF2945 domain-containing protein n=1 Tax=Flavobacterium litorale TaxID=2856519 RepID=A0ABX8V531_9FLAO|nr:DUF2945 domain-containing protein [Flavobacterium litorale]QYJ67953.1 DUF2945 domain-containing protein [Flavobacterium litorale]
MAYNENDKVEWNWGNGTGTGKVKKVYTQKVTKTIKGSEVTRNASKDDPAYLIEQEDGDEVLKGHDELKKK